MKWGNATITKKDVDANGMISLEAEALPDDKDFKKTKKITWITADPSTNIEFTLVELDHLITKKKVEENEKVQDIVNTNSYIAYNAFGMISMKDLK